MAAMTLTEAVDAALAGSWVDMDGVTRPYVDARDSDIAAGNCTQVNGDLGSDLAETGWAVSLVDLSRGSGFEVHTVAQVVTADGPQLVDAAWSQFDRPGATTAWPVVMPAADYLAWSGFHVTGFEAL